MSLLWLSRKSTISMSKLKVIISNKSELERNVEELLQQEFPHARIIRMDVDTTSRKGAHEKLLNDFEAGKGDILLGTQMIAKGLDYPNITLVGVLNADTIS